MLGSQAEIIMPFLSSALPIPLPLPCLLLNRPVRLGHPFYRFFQCLALIVEPFLLLKQGCFLLFQSRDAGHQVNFVFLPVLRNLVDCRLIQPQFRLVLVVELLPLPWVFDDAA